MTRLLVVSRNSGIWTALTQGADLDVVGLRPAKLDAWLDTDGHFDCAVIDVVSAADALDMIGRLRARQESVPCLLVSSDDPSWTVVQHQTLPSVGVLPLPLSRTDLLRSVAALTAGSESAPTYVHDSVDVPSAEPEPPEPGVVPFDKAAAALDSDVGQGPTEATDTQSAPVRGRRAKPRTTGSRRPSTATAASHKGSTAAAPAVPESNGSVNVSPDPPAARTHPPTSGLLRQVLAGAARLPHPGQVAAAIASSVGTVVGADALAVVCRDDGSWGVMAGHGLRTIEWARRMSDNHWLVSQVVHGRQGLVIEDTDIARSRLAGAPLSQWKHLLAASLSPIAFIVAGRSERRFTVSELTLVARAVDPDTLDLLGTALDARELARALEHLLDDPPAAFMADPDRPGAHRVLR